VSNKPRNLVTALLIFACIGVEPVFRAEEVQSIPDVVHRVQLDPQSPGATGQAGAAKADVSLDRSPVTVLTTPPKAEPEPETEAGRLKKAQALALIQYDWEPLGYEIRFLGPRPGYRAMTIADKKLIEVYVREGDDIEVLAFDLAHELGHAYDLERMDTRSRNRWRELRGIDPKIPWFGCNRCPDYETPAGDFAETFALLLLGSSNYHSRLCAAPAPEEMTLLRNLCGMPQNSQSGPRQTGPASAKVTSAVNANH
jgi:hypothetical protein